MKKSVLWAAVLALLLSGCAGRREKPVELTVFAAASLTETLTELGARYEAAAPGVRLLFDFDSSGTLKSQIEAGAVCDLFLSAAPKQMDALEEQALLLPDTRFDLLENRVVLVAPAGDPAGVRSFDELAARLAEGSVFLAMGNADVPVGQYTQRILEYYGLEEAALAEAGLLTYGSNVKEVTSQVAEGLVDCGVVYQTDAHAAGLTVLDTATAEQCGPVRYPAAVLKATAHEAEARALLAYLQADKEVFAAAGFTPLSR